MKKVTTADLIQANKDKIDTAKWAKFAPLVESGLYADERKPNHYIRVIGNTATGNITPDELLEEYIEVFSDFDDRLTSYAIKECVTTSFKEWENIELYIEQNIQRMDASKKELFCNYLAETVDNVYRNAHDDSTYTFTSGNFAYSNCNATELLADYVNYILPYDDNYESVKVLLTQYLSL